MVFKDLLGFIRKHFELLGLHVTLMNFNMLLVIIVAVNSNDVLLWLSCHGIYYRLPHFIYFNTHLWRLNRHLSHWVTHINIFKLEIDWLSISHLHILTISLIDINKHFLIQGICLVHVKILEALFWSNPAHLHVLNNSSLLGCTRSWSHRARNN